MERMLICRFKKENCCLLGIWIVYGVFFLLLCCFVVDVLQ